MSQRTLARINNEKHLPTQKTVKAFSEALHFPPEFFYGPALEEPPLHGASFRAFSRLTKRRQNKVRAAAGIGIALSDWIEREFKVPEPKIPHCDSTDPESAASEIRAKWNLGEQPIANMVHLLERYGVKVYSLAEDTREVDAFSFWRNDVPYVFLNTMKTSERSRMDAAHELGHLVLHRHEMTQKNKKAEDEAQAFGSAFLMPRESVVARLPWGASIADIVEAKQYWTVSVANLAYRLSVIGLLSPNQTRWTFQRIGQLGYRTEEPYEAPRETSAVLSKVFAIVRERGQTPADVAYNLSVYPDELGKLLMGSVPFPVEA